MGKKNRMNPAGCRRLTGNRVPGTEYGFTLVELMVVTAIIGILCSMVVTGIWAARRHFSKVEARMTMKQMAVGMINLKKNNEYDPMIPIGVYTAGCVQEATTQFSDSNRDFSGDGISAGDELYILGGTQTCKRNIVGVGATTLNLGGGNFAKSERDLEYFVIRSGGDLYPEINLGKELDPNNEAWAATFVPHLNGRKIRYYTCKPGRIDASNEFCDPWGNPYLYTLADDGNDVVVEKIQCAGQDMKMNTKDDIEEVIAEIPFGG